MTKKEMQQVEGILKKVLKDMLSEEEPVEIYHDLAVSFPVAILDKIEDFLGHPIDYMGIS
jgi:hypothetical protein